MTEETNKASGAEVLTTLNHMRRQAMYFRADNDLFPAKEAIQQTDEDRAAIAAVSALIAERDALREDAERLDWLAADMAKEDEGVGIDYADGRFRFAWLDNGAGGFGGGVYHANYDTLRDAIDDARTSPGAPK